MVTNLKHVLLKVLIALCVAFQAFVIGSDLFDRYVHPEEHVKYPAPWEFWETIVWTGVVL